ncbi:ABC transporter permease subunit [Halocatena marina]|uniref:ABC transporter permease subunit n=1 Tax=Halocatena marina TaxID=2934937 RepID=A0ABD5YV46_9EURY
MSTLLVAKKDVQDAIRSRTLLVVAGLFTAFLAFIIYYRIAMESPGRPVKVAGLYPSVATVISVIGTLLGYNAIVGERESGSVKFLLGQPHARRDVVVGKFLGRAAVVAVTVLVAFAVVGVHYAVLAESPSFTAYVLFVGKMLVLGVVFVAIAIAFSAALRSATAATWGAVGLAILFAFGWESVLIIIESLLVSGGSPPSWFLLFNRLNPKYALDTSASGVGGGAASFYLEPWFGVVILGGWLLVPLGLGYLRFQRGDLA